MKRKYALLFSGIICAAVIGVTCISVFAVPADGALLRCNIPTANDIKDTIRDESIETLEQKTSFIREYLKMIFDLA